MVGLTVLYKLISFVVVIGMLGVQLQINHESCTKRTEKLARVRSTTKYVT